MCSTLAGGALQGLGLGAASVAATARGVAVVAGSERGVASGLLTTAAQIGTALGVSALVWLASTRADATGGYRLGFAAAAGLAAIAAATVTRLSSASPAGAP